MSTVNAGWRGPNIVKDGLVFYLDAGSLTSYSIYNTGNTWKDISGNANSGSLVNGPTFSSSGGGCIIFDGGDDYVSTTFTVPAQNTTTSFSWNCWVYPVQNSNRDIFMGNRNTILNFIKLTSSNFEYYPVALGGAMTLNVWQNICVVKNLTNFFYYKNGIQTATLTSSATLLANPFFIGGDNTAGEYGGGRVAMEQIYDRALSPIEVLQNYNSTRTRFNL